MVLGFLLLIAQLVFGFELSSFFFGESFSFWPILAASIPSGMSISTMVYFLLTPFFGHNLFHLLLHTALLVTSIATVRSRLAHPPWKFELSHILIFPVYALLFTILFFSAYLRHGDSFSPLVVATLSEEISVIASFSYGGNRGVNPFLNFMHPLQFNEVISSRWLAAFHASMLQIGFSGLRLSLVLPCVLCSFSFAVLLYFLALEMALPPKVAWMAPLLPLLVAGYGFWDLGYPPGSSQRIDHVSRTKGGETPFFHPTMQVLLGHRSSAFTFAIAALAFLYLASIFRAPRPSDWKPIIFIGGLIGLLPALHIHGFVGLSLFAFIALLCALFVPNRAHIPYFFLGYLPSVS
jgi:hypothetical protein